MIVGVARRKIKFSLMIQRKYFKVSQTFYSLVLSFLFSLSAIALCMHIDCLLLNRIIRKLFVAHSTIENLSGASHFFLAPKTFLVKKVKKASQWVMDFLSKFIRSKQAPVGRKVKSIDEVNEASHGNFLSESPVMKFHLFSTISRKLLFQKVLRFDESSKCLHFAAQCFR